MARSRSIRSNTARWSRARRWTRDDATAALAALEESGEAVATFAGRHGVDAQRFYGWRRRLGPAIAEAPPAFVEVVGRPVAGGGQRGFDVVLPTGVIVRVPPGFDDDALRRLLAVVTGGPPC